MEQSINERVETLQALLKRKAIHAFIIPSSDPHLSEYVAPHWKSREWISGFTGSAGTTVITLIQAGLWTDSRYFLQAEQQLRNTKIKLYKEMLPETPTISEFLRTSLSANDIVGIDGKMFSAEHFHRLQADLKHYGIRLKDVSDLINEVWKNRPPIPEDPAFAYDLKYAGKSCTEKIQEIRSELEKSGSKAVLISSLDEIAWTLNLRGNDVHCNPVIISYLIILEKDVHYFITPSKVTPDITNYLEKTKIIIHKYNEIEPFLQQMETKSILIDTSKTNYSIYSSINPNCRIIQQSSPVALLKAIRNKQEIGGIHHAMKRDGVALVKFLKWLEEVVPSGTETEMSIDKKLHALRSEQALYKGESFDTIAGYKAHGAIVHYEATPETDARLKAEGFLLLDSGAQYLDGTTDITRTIALGKLTQEEKTDYTLILKGHIALAMAKFPAGTRGTQLDVLARMPIWQHKMNFLHGTGHGVGHFLNVHEGPQSIRMNENPIALQPGMVTSNEPGVYKAGSHGIRIENLTLVVPAGEGMFGSYLKFETLTLCPICKKGIIKDLLTEEEVNWFNDYHQMVYKELSPVLNKEEKTWLKEATANI
ncbi:MAG: aminopeptidase P family protein [Bacteroides sp.]|jgi:Xaa-Pro aminopeptidase|nr:aminopeptidase P family protein [Bacteroides sp.]MCI1683734.1 aminopeptidase P family protein [Bacteroides sp.]